MLTLLDESPGGKRGNRRCPRDRTSSTGKTLVGTKMGRLIQRHSDDDDYDVMLPGQRPIRRPVRGPKILFLIVSVVCYASGFKLPLSPGSAAVCVNQRDLCQFVPQLSTYLLFCVADRVLSFLAPTQRY